MDEWMEAGERKRQNNGLKLDKILNSFESCRSDCYTAFPGSPRMILIPSQRTTKSIYPFSDILI